MPPVEQLHWYSILCIVQKKTLINSEAYILGFWLHQFWTISSIEQVLFLMIEQQVSSLPNTPSEKNAEQSSDSV